MKKNFMRFIALLLTLSTLLAVCAVPASAYSVKWIRTTAKCYIRSEPDKSSESYRTAKKGEVFPYDTTAYDDRGVLWYGIVYGSVGTAWISSKNAKQTDDPRETKTPKPTAKPTPKPIDYSKFVACDTYVEVTGTSVNMRTKPSTDYAVIRSYKAGDILYATSTDGTWYEVYDEDTKVNGYMSAKYLARITKVVTPAAEDSELEQLNSFADLEEAMEDVALIDAPEGSTNVFYGIEVVSDDVVIGGISFTYEGADFTLYAVESGNAMALVDDDQKTLIVQDSVAVVGDNAEYYHTDAEGTTTYKLTGPAIMNGVAVSALAEILFA